MNTKFETQLSKLRNVADAVEGKLRTYSGRYMYGKQCLGITTDSPNRCIEEAGAEGIRGARQDSMGLRYIVYWPNIEVPEGFELD